MVRLEEFIDELKCALNSGKGFHIRLHVTRQFEVGSIEYQAHVLMIAKLLRGIRQFLEAKGSTFTLVITDDGFIIQPSVLQ